MSAELLQAQKAIQNARDALRSGDRSSARRWAEQAAKLAPQLEDPWLILASVASPHASVSFIERALQINPNSPRARKGMEWALKRLQEAPATQSKPPAAKPLSGTQPVKRAKRSAAPKKSARKIAVPVLLFVVGCLVVIAAAWTATNTPVLASILRGTQEPQVVSVAPREHPQVWARVEIAKPARTPESEPEPVLIAAEPTLPPPTATAPLTIAELVVVLPTQIPPTQPAPTQVSPTSTPGSEEPSVISGSTSTPAGSFAMEIVENTAVPTAQPPSEGIKPQVDTPVGNGVRWIEVNLSEQRTYAWEGDVLVNSFVVSTGTWATPTVVGTFNIWNKTRIQTMSGPGYSLPNVPFVMYFYKDYGFHGTYWHNNFGTPMSHGCVNLTIPDSEWLYNWASYGTTVKVHY